MARHPSSNASAGVRLSTVGRAMRQSGKTVGAAFAAFAAFAVAASACVATSDHGSGPGQRPGGNDAVITVGSFDFAESVLLANIYGQALAAKGFPVRIFPNLGTRELVDPALMSGLIQLVPEYAGSALQFATLGRRSATSNVEATSAALANSVAGRGLVVAHPAAAQDANAIVVTTTIAARYGLRSISDLAIASPHLIFGGPPECPERSYCLRGLTQTYRVRFKEFVPLDTGGPLTLQALSAGEIDAGLLFTTDPAIVAKHLVILTDDRGLQPAENIVPMVRRDAVAKYGPGLIAALDAVSARLSTKSLRALDSRVELDGRDPRAVAREWLRAQGLILKGGQRSE